MNIPQTLQEQRLFFRSQKTKDVKFRKEVLKKLKAETLNRENDFYEALYQDFKKSQFEAYLSEFGLVLKELNFTLRHIDNWAKPKRVLSSLLNFPSKDYIHSVPYGNVLVIAPWNYPLLLTITPIIAAIAAGNTCIVKPSEYTPNAAKLVEDIVAKVFQKEHVTVIQGGVNTSKELLAQRWDYIFFTGSVPIGRIVAKAAAEYMTPVTLELGGKTPCIVDDNVDIKLVAKRIVWGKFLNAGQTCIAPDYILVKSNIKEVLIEALKTEIKNAYGNDPKQSKDFPRIINSKNLDRLLKLIEDKTIAYGGVFDKESCYLSPTIVDNPDIESDLMKEEIFGPIIPVLNFETTTDIEQIVENMEHPLALYVFSKNSKFYNYVINRFSFGGGVINDTTIHFGNNRLPFGGVGASGIGAYHGKLGFDTFTHQKAVVKKANWLDVPFRYAPYKGKLKLLKTMFKWFG